MRAGKLVYKLDIRRSEWFYKWELEKREWARDELMSLLNALNARTSRNAGHRIIIFGGKK